MQAIARVNRVYKDKPGGLIVDYIGIGQDLRSAMRDYTESGGQGDVAPDISEIISAMNSDSSGKSGGQKEKLAYTILASALAYQFGLGRGGKRSRTFRFVVIDEAFGRGSDESTRYGLELFKRLNIQLLIVTPLQKINIIEDYISGVHFVHNEAGNGKPPPGIEIRPGPPRPPQGMPPFPDPSQAQPIYKRTGHSRGGHQIH